MVLADPPPTDNHHLNHPGPQLTLPTDLYEQMRRHVVSLTPEEACGLIAGRAGRAHQVFPITNQLRSPVRFRMAPDEQLRALIRMDELGLELAAIYHSHPEGPNQPSITDITEAYYPEAIYLIWFPGPTGWSCQGFSIQEGVVQEARIIIPENE